MSQYEETEPLVGDYSPGEMAQNADENQQSTDESALIEESLANLDLDKLLVERLGEFGRYQKLIYFLICLPAALTAGVTLSSVFTEFTPPHRCFIPGCDDPQAPRYDDAYYSDFYNFTVPATNPECNMFSRLDNVTKSCHPVDFSPLRTEECGRSLFNDSVMKSSVATEFSLVCEKQWQLPLSQSVFFAGVLVGAPVWGHMADILGRRVTFLLSLLETSVFGILAAFSVNFQMFVIVQFFTAMGQVGLFQTAFVLGIELVGPNKRTLCGILIEFVFVAGELYLALVAQQLRDWRKIQLACTLPCLVFFLYYFILPESVRWLLSKKKYTQAQNRLKTISARNNIEILRTEELVHYRVQEEETDESENTETMMDLLRRPRLVARLFNVFLNWFVITMIYYGLSLNAASLAGDVYINFALLSLCEVPGYAISYLGMRFAGRRLTLAASLLIGGVSCLISSLVTNADLSTAFFLLGKFGATAGFGTTYLYTGELFPTRVRSLCVGVSSMVGRLGAIMSPYIAELGLLTGLSWLSMAVFAGAALLSGLLTLLLPETKHKTLPRTIEEAENI